MSAGDLATTPDERRTWLVDYPEEVVARYRAAGLWSGTTLGEQLRASAAVHADRTALVTADATYSYAQLDERCQAFAAGVLASTSLRPGDPVMFSMGNTAETVIAYYGAVRAGLVPVCTLPQHREREIGLLAQHTQARGYIVQADFKSYALVELAHRACAASDTLAELIVARGAAPDAATPFDAILAAGSSDAAQARLQGISIDPNSIVAFQLSGGTTGLPKVAARRHEEYAYNSSQWARILGWGPDTTVLYPLPVMHNAGIALAIQPAHLSGSTVLLTASADSGVILDAIAEYRPDVMPLVPPAVAIRLLDDPRSRDVDMSCIDDFIVGGQRLPIEVAHRLERELGIRCRQMFGMAEGMFLVTPRDADDEIRLHTVGAPISPEDEVRVYDVGTETEVPDGQVGELCARGPYTIRGYYRAPEHNAKAFTGDGFYRTGDLSRRHVVNGATYYSIDGRIKDVINRGVEKIHTEEVEELVLQHPDILNAALVAMPDRVLGERVCAYVVQRPDSLDLTVATLGEHLLLMGLATYKLPERVEILDSLPLTNVGKVSKKHLREDIAATLAAEGANGDSQA
jgi:2,3-dihydroxybenzoate-AMP ligase